MCSVTSIFFGVVLGESEGLKEGFEGTLRWIYFEERGGMRGRSAGFWRSRAPF